ncbi:MAG TPA: glycosyltransferase family 2 protein [Fimbriiglobus sp.]|jgi:glycosyltransferase involved in cell wall biosynthesis|nr:glycosyltransferase family 2 protein [Fimbriiglobus sp.]
MSRPRFSIVIPTRERADTLRWSLQTAIDQDFDSFEIVVCDNHSSQETRDVVEAAASPRLRYVRAPRPLAMSANWELAVGEANGEYVTVLGDDDGLLPFALAEADHLIRRHGANALRCQRGLYTWPTLPDPADANFLHLPLTRYVKECDAREWIGKLARFEVGADMLPMVYNSFIHRNIIARHRELAGKVFASAYPDIYSGIGLGYVAGRFLSVGLPLNVAGLSGRSNGMATLLRDARNPIASEFFQLSRSDGYPPHPTVPDLPVWPVPTLDSFQYARDHLFPHDAGLCADRQLVTKVVLEAIPLTGADERSQARRVIRDSLADRPDLLPWFDGLADPPPFVPRLLGALKPGFHCDHLNLRTAPFGIANVRDAVRFAANLLGLTPGSIDYDMPPRGEPLDAANRRALAGEARAARAEAELAGALRDGALRHVPRRVARKVAGMIGSLGRRAAGLW